MILLHQRRVVPELMDAPDVEASAHREALAGLQRINRLSHTAARIARPILDVARRDSLAELSLLDVACGGGEVPVQVAALLQEAGIRVRLTLMDRSATALREAMAKAEALTAAGGGAAGEVLCAQGEAPAGLPDGPFDVVTNSLFLHHLDREDVVRLLAETRVRARGLLVISDLRRSPIGLALAWAGCRVLSRSAIVHHDGPASVRAAWTMPELAAMAADAGLAGARVEPCWPWRMLLTWEPRGAGVSAAKGAPDGR